VTEQTDKLRFREICDVSRETFDKLEEYSSFLKETNDKFNLVGKSTLQSIWVRHFADSIKLKPIIEMALDSAGKKIKICDVGSGAGFPGMVLAILANTNKWNVTITLIESNIKKANFLQELSRILKLNILIITKRAEQVDETFDIITARALSKLRNLLIVCRKLKHRKTNFFLLKGRNWENEMIEAKKQWNFSFKVVKNNKILDKTGGVTLLLNNVVRKK
jgi:16S rRNA (guanine527-N7)-methyltransferase